MIEPRLGDSGGMEVHPAVRCDQALVTIFQHQLIELIHIENITHIVSPDSDLTQPVSPVESSPISMLLWACLGLRHTLMSSSGWQEVDAIGVFLDVCCFHSLAPLRCLQGE